MVRRRISGRAAGASGVAVPAWGLPVRVLASEERLGRVEVGGVHVVEQDGEAGAGSGESQPAAERACSDDGYGRWQQDYWADRAWTTSSALGLALSRCSATRARSSAVRVGMVASTRRRVTATSSM